MNCIEVIGNNLYYESQKIGEISIIEGTSLYDTVKNLITKENSMSYDDETDTLLSLCEDLENILGFLKDSIEDLGR